MRIAGCSSVALICLGVAAGAQSQQPPHKPGHMEHRFDDPERYAKSFDDPARDAWQMPHEVVMALNLKWTDTVADIGAGTGYFTVRLAKTPARPKVYAVDIEPSMVEYLRHRAAKEGLANVTAIRADADRPNLPEPVDEVGQVGEELFHARTRVIWAAKAAGIQAIDSIFADVSDMEGLRRETKLIKTLGFNGKSLVNPRQIEVVHEVFAPKQEEVDYALQVVEAIGRARAMGTGVISLGGKMVDAPVVKRAVRVLKTARAHGLIDIELDEEAIYGEK